MKRYAGDRTRRRMAWVALAACVALGSASMAAVDVSHYSFVSVYMSDTVSSNTDARNQWLAGMSPYVPETTVTFETGFTNGQSLNGHVFPSGMVMTTNGGPGTTATVVSGGTSIGGSSPIDTYAARHSETSTLEFDFSSSPVLAFGFIYIDMLPSDIVVTFLGGGSQTFEADGTITTGNSGEFLGLVATNGEKIEKVQLSAFGGGDNQRGVDNLEYVVPEPSAAVLLAVAAGLSALRRRRRQDA